MGPGALLLLGQSSDPTKNGGAPVAVAYNTKLILINANGQLSICVGACAAGVVIDTVSWGALSDDQTGHALIVDPATKDLCTASAPFGTRRQLRHARGAEPSLRRKRRRGIAAGRFCCRLRRRRQGAAS